LSEAILAETRGVSIRLSAGRVRIEQMQALRDVLQASPGKCPVSLVIDLGDGAEALLSLGASLRVAATDEMLAGLERLFGENVTELR
jgi:hypothetical protein